MAQANQMDPDRSRFFEELGKAGSQHAAHALAALLRVPVDVTTLQVRVMDVLAVATSPGVAGEVLLGVYFTIYGDGSVLVMVSREHACRLVDLLRKPPPETTRALDEQALSIVRETANILAGAYLGAIRSLVSTPLIHSIPYLAIDHWEVIVNSLLPGLAERAEQVTLIEADLAAGDVEVRCRLLVVAGEWFR